MTYENEILKILNEADPQKGLPLSTIVRHIHNLTNCDLFESRSYEDIYTDVQRFLRTSVTQSGSPFEKTDKRGYYRINPRSIKVQQLKLNFGEEASPPALPT